MAVVMRGWSKTASTALKLATAERIIGYQFKDLDKLYEALDQTEQRRLLPSGKKLRLRPRNSRLALVGDALGTLHMAKEWYDTNLTGGEWNEIALSTLSNERFGRIGFQLGLDECANTFATDITLLSPPKRTWFTDESEVSKEIVRPYDMATTLEALIAAVHMDGASQEQCRKIYTRFGLQHKLVGPIDRSWIWKIVRSKMDLPEKFFIGHHFKLQEGIFETQLKRLPAQKEEGIGMWGRAKRLWRRTRRLWRRTKRLWQPEKKTEKKRVSQPRSRRRVSRSATQLPRSVDPSAESTRSAATETTSPTLDVATSEIEFAPEDSPGRCENDEQAASLEQTIDRVDLAETNGAAEVSSSQLPTSSRPTKRRTGPARPEEDTSNDVESAETGAQGSNTASKEEAASPSSKDVAATGVELKVEHQSHEVSETELAEATKEDDSEQDLKQATQEMAKEAKVLQEVWHQLVLATEGRKRTTAEQQQLANLKEQRKQIIDKRSRMLNILKRSS